MKIRQRLALTYIRTKYRVLSFLSPRLAARSAFQLFCTQDDREVQPLPKNFLEAEQLNFSFDGYEIRGYRWNKGGKARAMIIHGFRSSAINFEAYVEPLIGRNFEVLIFDGPAHGRSSGRRMNAIIYRDFIRHVHEQYGPVNAFVAHSLGGLSLALALASLPHDAHTRVALLAPATETSTAMRHFFTLLALNARVQQQFTQLVISLSGMQIAEISVTEAMKNVKATVLWIHDEVDKVTPLEDAQAVQKANYPNVIFVTTNGLGHSGLYRNASVQRRVVDFLDGTMAP